MTSAPQDSIPFGHFSEDDREYVITDPFAPPRAQVKKEEMLGRVRIETPDLSVNRLVNVWSKQQIQLCVEFGRDGARGFRDTLQDAWGILPFMRGTINLHGWDGDWYLAGWSDAGNPVGSHKNSEGRIFLNTQTWAVLTGIATGDRLEKCWKAIDGTLESWKKVMPDNPGHPSAVSGCEPYAFTNQSLGPTNGRAGDSISGWITGTAGWMFRAVLEYFCGVRPGYYGLEIQPSLPSEWAGAQVRRMFRGQEFQIEISKRTSGEPAVTVNGKACNDGFVSLNEKPREEAGA